MAESTNRVQRWAFVNRVVNTDIVRSAHINLIELFLHSTNKRTFDIYKYSLH